MSWFHIDYDFGKKYKNPDFCSGVLVSAQIALKVSEIESTENF